MAGTLHDVMLRRSDLLSPHWNWEIFFNQWRDVIRFALLELWEMDWEEEERLEEGRPVRNTISGPGYSGSCGGGNEKQEDGIKRRWRKNGQNLMTEMRPEG